MVPNPPDLNYHSAQAPSAPAWVSLVLCGRGLAALETSQSGGTLFFWAAVRGKEGSQLFGTRVHPRAAPVLVRWFTPKSANEYMPPCVRSAYGQITFLRQEDR